MAKIREFVEGDRNVKPPQSEVDGFFQVVRESDGTKYLYLYNYSQRGQEPGASPTQSLHFDIAAAREFKRILEETFGPL
jgi:hypothetical protein